MLGSWLALIFPNLEARFDGCVRVVLQEVQPRSRGNFHAKHPQKKLGSVIISQESIVALHKLTVRLGFSASSTRKLFGRQRWEAPQMYGTVSKALCQFQSSSGSWSVLHLHGRRFFRPGGDDNQEPGFRHRQAEQRWRPVSNWSADQRNRLFPPLDAGEGSQPLGQGQRTALAFFFPCRVKVPRRLPPAPPKPPTSDAVLFCPSVYH